MRVTILYICVSFSIYSMVPYHDDNRYKDENIFYSTFDRNDEVSLDDHMKDIVQEAKKVAHQLIHYDDASHSDVHDSVIGCHEDITTRYDAYLPQRIYSHRYDTLSCAQRDMAAVINTPHNHEQVQQVPSEDRYDSQRARVEPETSRCNIFT